METIVYASLAARAMDDPDLEALLLDARTRNEAAEITGMLVYADGSFLQQLEGEAAAVRETFARIEADQRHTAVRMLSQRPIDERRFPAWSMGFDAVDPEELRRRAEGYLPPHGVELPSTELIVDTEIAEALLGLYALNVEPD
jgi:hypothetical protein